MKSWPTKPQISSIAQEPKPALPDVVDVIMTRGNLVVMKKIPVAQIEKTLNVSGMLGGYLAEEIVEMAYGRQP